MPAHDLPLLLGAARAASASALGHAGPAARRWDKPGGAGPVTEADIEVDRLLRARLMAARPSYGWLSEETEDSDARLHRRRVFIVDPIDGTRSFIDGAADWAHALAVAEDGQVTAAVILLPMRDLTYAAARGHGATLNGAPIRTSDRSALSGASVLAARPALEPRRWRGGAVPAVVRSLRASLAWRLALVAEGRYDAILTLRPTWEWDIAAGALILSEAGALATDRHGAALRFNSPDPRLDGVLAANPALHARLLAALSG